MAITGRPMTLTNDLTQRIVDRIRKGNHPESAAEAEHVPLSTFYEWIQRGKGEHPTRPQTEELAFFADAITCARAEAEGRILDKLNAILDSEGAYSGIEANAQARGEEARIKLAQWMLERGFSRRWGAKAEAESGMNGAGSSDRPAITITYAAPKEPAK